MTKEDKIKNPKISICIPLYNVEKYVERCLDSILKQDFEDYEVIIVNDASTDKSGELVAQIAEKNPKIRVITNSKNKGTMVTREIAYTNATGDYLVFVDPDDIILPNSLSLMYNEIHGSNLDMVIFGYKIYKQNGDIILNSIKEKSITNTKDALLYFLEGKVSVYLWDKIFERDFIINNRVKNIEGLIHGEDFIFMSQLFNKCKNIKFVNQPIYGYHENINSMTYGFLSDHKTLNFIKLLEFWRAFAKENEFPLHETNLRIMSFIFILFERSNNPTLVRQNLGNLKDLVKFKSFLREYGYKTGLIQYLLYKGFISKKNLHKLIKFKDILFSKR